MEPEEAEEEPLPPLVSSKPRRCDGWPPPGQQAGTPGSKPSSHGVAFVTHLHLAPEDLDPRTLRLLWEQRELEIQALRWGIRNPHDARRQQVLQEVAGTPLERSWLGQERILQEQVEKLTLALKEQQQQAELEKASLEEQLQQTQVTMHRLESELQAFRKSCLLQLARSSWVGRMLRSSTGSVEVVTAEALMDTLDLSEEQGPSTESFRLENVDWNSIAHRYPNLFTDMQSSQEHRHVWQPRPPQLPLAPAAHEEEEEEVDEAVQMQRRQQHRLKSVEWSALPVRQSSSSSPGVTDSEASSRERRGRTPRHKRPGPRTRHLLHQHILAHRGGAAKDSEAEREEPRGPAGRDGAGSRVRGGCPAAERPASTQPPLLLPEDRGCEPPAEVRVRPQPVPGGDGRPGRLLLVPAAARVPGVHLPLPATHAAGPRAPCHGVGRGHWRPEAVDLVPGLGARPLPLGPGLRDPPAGPQGPGPQPLPGPTLRDRSLQSLPGQHRPVGRPLLDRPAGHPRAEAPCKACEQARG